LKFLPDWPNGQEIAEWRCLADKHEKHCTSELEIWPGFRDFKGLAKLRCGKTPPANEYR